MTFTMILERTEVIVIGRLCPATFEESSFFFIWKCMRARTFFKEFDPSSEGQFLITYVFNDTRSNNINIILYNILLLFDQFRIRRQNIVENRTWIKFKLYHE